MRCEQFASRMNDLLDAHREPAEDAALGAHARDCAPCARTLRQWQQVQRALQRCPAPSSPAPSSPATPLAALNFLRSESQDDANTGGRRRRMAAVVASLAAAWLISTNLPLDLIPAPEPLPTPVASTVEIPPLDLRSISMRMHQPQWWGSVMVAAWEPVDPLADGIRPLTDSFQTALEVLAPLQLHPRDPGSPAPTEDASAGHSNPRPASLA